MAMTVSNSGDGPLRDCGNAGAERSETSPTVWSEHEQVATPVQVQAQKLLDQAGSPGLAKHAVDTVAETMPAPRSRQDAFASQLGFVSYLSLFEASTPIRSAAGKHWCLTALGGDGWIAWNDEDLVASQVFPSREAAQQQIPA